MSVHIHRPAAPLAQLVHCFWHWDSDPAPAPRERTLPAGTLDLIINLSRDSVTFLELDERTQRPYAGAVVCGAHAGYRVFDATAHSHVMGVHFRPGGARPFLGRSASASELESGIVDLELLWGSSARALRERLVEASGAHARFEILERALLTAAQRTLLCPPAVAQALRAFEDPALPSVSAVNDLTGMSAKRLIALFREHVGLTPKAYWRVRRFQAALRALDGRAAVSCSGLALELGYYDQSHFINEFQTFAGMSPAEYLKHERWRPNHVPLRG